MVFALDALLLFKARYAALAVAVTHALLVALAAIFRHQSGKALRLDLSGNQLLDEGDVDSAGRVQEYGRLGRGGV